MDEEQEEKTLEELRKAKEAEEKLMSMMRVILNPPAYERLAMIKLSSAHRNPAFFQTLCQNLLYAYKRLNKKITEHELLMIAKKISGTKREGNITFRRK